ncbi:zinc-ribbon domain-containing protein [bacterium]|nr:MAG: zinc-ribbon domain-containing protein [bacterium]
MSLQETIPPATPGVSAVAGIECPACGTQNTNDSKFCRHCGHLLRPLLSGSSDAKKAAPVDGAALADDDNLTSPAEIDARRAYQLLDRALLLSERGDLNAALLACRQAIALDHAHSEGYALLGTLLERNGDLRGAMSAYEHVLEISPDNELERDSLNRIKARLEKAPAFNFNPNELFGDTEEAATSNAAPVADATEELPLEDLSAIAPEREEHGIEARLPPSSRGAGVEKETPSVTPVVAPVAFDFDPTPEGATPSLSPLAAALDGETIARVGAAIPPSSKPATPPSASVIGDIPKIDRRVAQRRQVNIRVANERRVGKDRRASAAAAASTVTPSAWSNRPSPGLFPPVTTPSTVAPLDFSFGATPAAPTPMWAQMLRGSSFYGRTLPLVVVGVLALVFLGWARSQAVARDASAGADTFAVADPTDTTGQFPQQPQTNVSPGTTFGSQTAPNTNTGNNGGFPITNATQAPAPPTNTVNPPASNPSPNVSNGNRPSAGAQGSGNGDAGRNNSAGTPPFPVPIAPAPVPPAPTRNTSSNNSDGGSNNNSGSGGNLILPPPQGTNNSGGADTNRIRVGSLGGAPLNPGGDPQERIRISQGTILTRPAAPPRSGTEARGNERAAAAAAANGNQDRAINNLTNAINSTGNDQGFLLQQRAMAFMDRGDYNRAVDDFQAAINAYQDQINSGQNVASAQAGLRSARSGLNLALSQR